MPRWRGNIPPTAQPNWATRYKTRQPERSPRNVCAIPDIQAHTARTATDGNTGARSEGTEDLLETDFGRRLRNSSPQRQPCREREDSGCSALQNQCLPLRNGHYEFRALHHETHHSEEPSETRDRSTARRENLLSALRKAPTRNNLQTPEKGQQETPQSDEALRQKSQSRASEFQNDVCQNQPRQRPARNSSCREGRQTATQQKTRGQEESQRKDPLQNPQPPRGTALQTPSTMPPEGREAQPETDSTTRRHDRPAERTRETSRDSQAASDLTELAIPAHSRLPADGDAMCSFPLDIENAVLEKSVSAMKGDCQREARML